MPEYYCAEATEPDRSAGVVTRAGTAQEAGDIQRRRWQRIALVAAHGRVVARLPARRGRGDLLGRAGHEVPPHEQRLAERRAAEQENAAALGRRQAYPVTPGRHVQQLPWLQGDAVRRWPSGDNSAPGGHEQHVLEGRVKRKVGLRGGGGGR